MVVVAGSRSLAGPDQVGRCAMSRARWCSGVCTYYTVA